MNTKLRLGILLLGSTLMLTSCGDFDKYITYVNDRVDELVAIKEDEPYNGRIMNRDNHQEGNIMSKGNKLIHVEDGDEVSLKNEIGSIQMELSDSNEISLFYEILIDGATASEEEKILQEMQIILEKDDDEIMIMAVDKNGDLFGSNKGRVPKNVTVETNFIVHIPKEIEKVTIENGIGQVDLESMQCELDISVGIGSVNGTNSTIVNEAAIKVGVGNLNMGINQLEDCDNIKFEVGTGDIELNLARELSMTLVTEGFLSDKKSTVLNGGDTDLKAITGVGSINIHYVD